jgi:hypothetical protein
MTTFIGGRVTIKYRERTLTTKQINSNLLKMQVFLYIMPCGVVTWSLDMTSHRRRLNTAVRSSNHEQYVLLLWLLLLSLTVKGMAEFARLMFCKSLFNFTSRRRKTISMQELQGHCRNASHSHVLCTSLLKLTCPCLSSNLRLFCQES